MSKIKGIVEWFEACPLIENAGSIERKRIICCFSSLHSSLLSVSTLMSIWSRSKTG